MMAVDRVETRRSSRAPETTGSVLIVFSSDPQQGPRRLLTKLSARVFSLRVCCDYSVVRLARQKNRKIGELKK